MSKRVPISVFVSELKAALERGDGYIMGSYGQNPRTGYLDLNETKVKGSWKEGGWYYTQYSGSQRTQALKWRKKCARVWDCNGMAEGIYEIHTGTCINARARNNYASWCSVRGKGLIPAKYRVPGAAVFWSNAGASDIHHVAYLWKPVTDGRPAGDWYIIEAKGVMYGVVKSKLLSRKPNYWGIMDKYFEYEGTGDREQGTGENGQADSRRDAIIGVRDDETGEVVPLLGSRTLKNGCEGADVKEMQAGLIRLGYDLGRWGADGDFGDCTEQAVAAFQRDNGLKETGRFDGAALAAFEAALAALDAPVDAPRGVVIEGGNCYVRAAPNTDGRILGVARRGETLAFGGAVDEATRWLAVNYRGQSGWVSGKYGRLAG